MVLNHRTVNEADVTPRDDLVQECLHRLRQSPPTFSSAVVGRVDHGYVPFVFSKELVEDLVDADVPEVKPRRHPAGTFLFGVVSRLMISGQASSGKSSPTTFGFSVPTFFAEDGGNIVVNG